MPPAAAQEEDALSPRAVNEAAVPSVMARAVDGFIIPGYRDLAEATNSLSDASAALCKSPSDATLDVARSAFSSVVQAWSAIEIIRLGPALEQNRFERFLFYPDRKSTGRKQVQAILAKQDESATTAESLKGKSVAVQGLGALELVLYGNGAEILSSGSGGFRCRYGLAVSQNLRNIAGEFLAEWEKPDGIQAAWKKPGTSNPLFRDNKEAATELLGVLVHSVEMVKDQRLRPFYAGTIDGKPDKGRPKLAIYWRSVNTMPAISANFSALQRLFDTAGMEEPSTGRQPFDCRLHRLPFQGPDCGCGSYGGSRRRSACRRKAARHTRFHCAQHGRPARPAQPPIRGIDRARRRFLLRRRRLTRERENAAEPDG